MRTRSKLFIAMLAATLAATSHASTTVLPDACGSDKTQFDVTTQKVANPSQKAADGKARVVFVQITVKQGGLSFGLGDFTTRFGLDGAWTGAASNNSYFALDIDPGEHHLCASVQGGSGPAKKMVAADSFTAEAGKIYYFAFTTTRLSGQSNFYGSQLSTLNPDEGKYRTKALPLSTSTPAK